TTVETTPRTGTSNLAQALFWRPLAIWTRAAEGRKGGDDGDAPLVQLTYAAPGATAILARERQRGGRGPPNAYATAAVRDGFRPRAGSTLPAAQTRRCTGGYGTGRAGAPGCRAIGGPLLEAGRRGVGAVRYGGRGVPVRAPAGRAPGKGRRGRLPGC